MKKCPYCAEDIQDDAIKCRHCREFLDGSSSRRLTNEKGAWYFRTAFIVFAVCSVGPLALPLLWLRPKTALAWKIGLSILILVLSWFLYQATLESLRTLKEYYKLIEGV